ncbi:MAG: lipoate--protein ligase [Bacteroidales bacterium]|nr:lipoate--protein ligase [Bacteroidales bacterium]
MKYILNPSTDPYWNMAFDEFALENLQVNEPVFYLWQNAPSVIIGLNQSAYAEVNLPFIEEEGIILARRVTGGGAVYHDLGNLNYSIVGPLDTMGDAPYLMTGALIQMGLNAERSGRNDIFVDGRKCSGYAKRLHKNRMMIHGTLMWDVDLETLTKALSVPGSKLEAAGVASVRSRVANLKSYLSQYADVQEFKEGLHGIFADVDEEIDLTQEELDSVTKLAREKFRSWSWNYGRSPETTFQKTIKFPCGTVTAHYTLDHGVFSEILFSGDFLGAKPANELADQLLGKRPEDLQGLAASEYFDGITVEELLQLFR